MLPISLGISFPIKGNIHATDITMIAKIEGIESVDIISDIFFPLEKIVKNHSVTINPNNGRIILKIFIIIGDVFSHTEII